MKALVPAALLLALAGCGGRGDLTPPEGASLPVKPYGAVATPTAAVLLTPSTQARPDRSDELLTSSQERARDDFDLPPN